MDSAIQKLTIDQADLQNPIEIDDFTHVEDILKKAEQVVASGGLVVISDKSGKQSTLEISSMLELKRFAESVIGPVNKIFRLLATNPDGKMWEWSDKTSGEIIIRAKDENEARYLASERHTKACVSIVVSETCLCPWTLTDHSICEELDSSEYSVFGVEQILEES